LFASHHDRAFFVDRKKLTRTKLSHVKYCRSQVQSGPASLATAWTTMTETKEAGHARQAAEAGARRAARRGEARAKDAGHRRRDRRGDPRAARPCHTNGENYRKVRAQLAQHGFVIGGKRVLRLIRAHELLSPHGRRCRPASAGTLKKID
jgi:hypothetical protein